MKIAVAGTGYVGLSIATLLLDVTLSSSNKSTTSKLSTSAIDWSSVVLAFENSKGISEEVKKPKALGDIRGVSYIYPILWRFGLIRVPEAIEKKMGKQR